MENVDINSLKGNPKNPRTISKHDYEALLKSIKSFGDLSGIVFNRTTQQLVGGHQRIQAFKQLGGQPVIEERLDVPNSVGTVARGHVLLGDEKYSYREVEWVPEFETAANVAANRIQGEFDKDLLAELVYEISQLENGQDLTKLMGLEDDELNKLLAMVSGDGSDGSDEPKGNLADDFIVPPFSVLDTKQGYWQSRKRAWLDLGLKSELGRNDIGSISDSAQNGLNKMAGTDFSGGTSVFDPVLCEVGYRWFNVPGGLILDPFAGGSVRGVIASKLGHQYIGLELRAEQVEANRVQAGKLCDDPLPVWIEGDSNKTLDTVDAQADLIFSCPPYADLEVYSDDPDDLSNMPYPKFLEFYQSIITKACNKLKPGRFAVWVIGEVRGKDGNYYNFVGDTIQSFKNAGLSYYNEMILVNTAGTLPLRAAKVFNSGRKIGKQHQNVLVFYKGNPQEIKANFGSLDFSKLEDMFADEIKAGELSATIPQTEEATKEEYLTE